jgi:hypothetical protein
MRRLRYGLFGNSQRGQFDGELRLDGGRLDGRLNHISGRCP